MTTTTATVVPGMSASEILAAYRIAKAAEDTVADAQRAAYTEELKSGLDLIRSHTDVKPSATSKFVGFRAGPLAYTDDDGEVYTVSVIFTHTARTKERGELIAALKDSLGKSPTRDETKAFLAAVDTEAGTESDDSTEE